MRQDGVLLTSGSNGGNEMAAAWAKMTREAVEFAEWLGREVE